MTVWQSIAVGWILMSITMVAFIMFMKASEETITKVVQYSFLISVPLLTAAIFSAVIWGVSNF